MLRERVLAAVEDSVRGVRRIAEGRRVVAVLAACLPGVTQLADIGLPLDELASCGADFDVESIVRAEDGTELPISRSGYQKLREMMR